jgi:hypothetical protein
MRTARLAGPPSVSLLVRVLEVLKRSTRRA